MSHLRPLREMIWPTLRAIEIFLLARKKTHTSRTRPDYEKVFISCLGKRWLIGRKSIIEGDGWPAEVEVQLLTLGSLNWAHNSHTEHTCSRSDCPVFHR
jgi:hypothetical protein